MILRRETHLGHLQPMCMHLQLHAHRMGSETRLTLARVDRVKVEALTLHFGSQLLRQVGHIADQRKPMWRITLLTRRRHAFYPFGVEGVGNFFGTRLQT